LVLRALDRRGCLCLFKESNDVLPSQELSNVSEGASIALVVVLRESLGALA
jgi:hypothetical protein